MSRVRRALTLYLCQGNKEMKFLQAFTVIVFIHALASSATIYVPDNYPGIQLAINAANNGDQIIVRPGTYVEVIDFIGKEIVLKSDEGPEVTMIDGNFFWNAVTFQSGEGTDSVLDGFTIFNGAGHLWGGGGIRCDGTSPSILNNIIKGSGEAGNGGGGILIDGGSPLIIDNKITDNFAWGNGGGIACLNGAEPYIERNVVEGNNAMGGGGGIFCGPGCSPTITWCTIRENDASLVGGGICCEADSSPLIMNNRILWNHAYTGGGISCESNTPTILKNEIVNNAASNGGGLFLVKVNMANGFFGNIVSGNVASEDAGGMRLEACMASELVNCVIADNSTQSLFGSSGGGIYCTQETDLSLINCTIVNNGSTMSCYYGGGIACWVSGSLSMQNSIVWGNSATIGKQVYLGPGIPASCDVSHTDVDGGQNGFYFDSNWTFNWGSGMLDDDPLFVDSSNDDFHLTWDSPCRNSGDNSVVMESYDFENDPRIVGTAVDMGADEFYSHLYHSGDVLPGNTIDLRVIGYPQAPVTLAWGQTIIDPPLSTQHGNLYIWPFVWSGFIGNVQSNGVLSMPVTIPSTWQPGDHAPLQALVGPWGGGWTKLTNLDDVTVK